MNSLKNFSSALILFILFIFPHNSYSDSHNIKEIRGLIRIGGRRWDIILKSDIRIKLPEKIGVPYKKGEIN